MNFLEENMYSRTFDNIVILYLGHDFYLNDLYVLKFLRQLNHF